MSQTGNATLIVHPVAGGWAWRIIAGNHRSIGVSPRSFGSEQEAAASVAALARTESLTPQIAHPRSSLTWKWSAFDASGELVARGDREYGRYGTCMSAYRRFVGTLQALAVVQPLVASTARAPGSREEPVVSD